MNSNSNEMESLFKEEEHILLNNLEKNKNVLHHIFLKGASKLLESNESDKEKIKLSPVSSENIEKTGIQNVFDYFKKFFLTYQNENQKTFFGNEEKNSSLLKWLENGENKKLSLFFLEKKECFWNVCLLYLKKKLKLQDLNEEKLKNNCLELLQKKRILKKIDKFFKTLKNYDETLYENKANILKKDQISSKKGDNDEVKDEEEESKNKTIGIPKEMLGKIKESIQRINFHIENFNLSKLKTLKSSTLDNSFQNFIEDFFRQLEDILGLLAENFHNINQEKEKIVKEKKYFENVSKENEQKLKNEKKELKKENKILKKQNDQKDGTFKNLENKTKEELEEVEKKSKEREEKIKNLEIQIANLKEANSNTMKTYLETKNERDLLKEKNQNMEEELQNLSIKKEKEIKALNAVLEKKLKDSEEMMEKYKKELKDAMKAIQEIYAFTKKQNLSPDYQNNKYDAILKSEDCNKSLEILKKYLNECFLLIENRIGIFENDKIKLTEKESQYIEQIRSIYSELNNLKAKKLEDEKKISQINNEKENAIKELADKIKKKSQQKKKLKNERDLLKQQKESYEDRISELNQIAKEYECLKANLFSKPSKKNSDFLLYDQIIDINSLKTHTLGWKNIYNEKTLSKIKIGDSYSIVGIVGRENIGKTFILNRLCDFDLPSGANVNTKGLSLKYSKNKHMICLDSAGIHTPVYYFNKNVQKRFSVSQNNGNKDISFNEDIRYEMINDRTLTDLFVQDFILEVCELIIIVVGQLSQNDQKFIERIIGKYQFKKKIVIIHNFSNLYTVEDVEAKIEKDIKEAFQVKEVCITNSDVYQYIEESKKKNLENISHLVLAADWAESGKKFNKHTFRYLNNILDTRSDRKPFNLVDKLIEFFNDNYRLYLRFHKKPSKVELIEKNNELLIQTDQEYEISNPVFNILGSLVTNPPYEVYELGDENLEKYLVIIDLPNINPSSLKININKKSEFNCLEVTGSRNEVVIHDNILKINESGNSGLVSCKIPLGERNIEVKLDKNFKYSEGVLRVEVQAILDEVQQI